ncbi:coenzyme F420-0:L-glutamate ligase [Oryzihumus sp.]
MTFPAPAVTVTAVAGVPEVRAGDDLAGLLVTALRDAGLELADGDVLVVSSKVVSKAAGLTAPAASRDDAVVAQSLRVVAERVTPTGTARVVESAAGPVMAAAGVDASNTGDDAVVLLLPSDPDAAAASLRDAVLAAWGRPVHIGLVLSDTAGRPWRVGQTDFALGACGVTTVEDLRGGVDADGRPLQVTVRCVADELAAAADLVKGKDRAVPVALVRGSGAVRADGAGARTIVRTGPEDWFGLGRVEAVRAALGVPPGTAAALDVGIPAAWPEDRPTRVARAVRVALRDQDEVAADVGADEVELSGEDDFSAGLVAARLLVALHGEGLAGTVRRGGRAGHAAVVVHAPA